MLSSRIRFRFTRVKKEKKVQLKNYIKKIRKKIFDSVQISETFLLQAIDI